MDAARLLAEIDDGPRLRRHYNNITQNTHNDDDPDWFTRPFEIVFRRSDVLVGMT
jgi:hypothetical protein